MSSSTASKTKTAKVAKTITQYQYAYVFNGGVLKQNHCIIGTSTEFPGTTIFANLSKYYGPDIKGAYYKCTKTEEEIQNGIKYKFNDKCITEMLFGCGFSDAKKTMLEITGLKQCSGTINVYKTSDEKDKTDENADKVEARL